jgi:hypothetical protein
MGKIAYTKLKILFSAFIAFTAHGGLKNLRKLLDFIKVNGYAAFHIIFVLFLLKKEKSPLTY